MGFRLPDETYKLVIDDGAYNGAEAKVRGLSAGQLIDVSSLAEGVDGDAATEGVADLIAMFTDSLDEWNIETPGGQPIPADLDGVRSAPFPLILEFVGLWMTAGGGIDGPLGSTLPGGGQRAEAHIPMEPLSPNPTPSPVPT